LYLYLYLYLYSDLSAYADKVVEKNKKKSRDLSLSVRCPSFVVRIAGFSAPIPKSRCVSKELLDWMITRTDSRWFREFNLVSSRLVSNHSLPFYRFGGFVVAAFAAARVKYVTTPDTYARHR